MAGKRRIWGDRAFRRLIKKMPEAIREELVDMMGDTASAMLLAQQASVPVRSGALRAGLSKRVYPRSLRIRVGLIGAAVTRRLPYRNVVEFGQTPKTVAATRRTPSGGVSRYRIRLPAVRKRPFIFAERVLQLRNSMRGKIRGFWDRVLRRAAQGGGDDN